MHYDVDAVRRDLAHLREQVRGVIDGGLGTEAGDELALLVGVRGGEDRGGRCARALRPDGADRSRPVLLSRGSGGHWPSHDGAAGHVAAGRSALCW
jgi:ribosomal protein S6E (S10)